MQYLIFSKETNELIDIFDFNDIELKKYLSKNSDFYAEESREIEEDFLDDDMYDEFLEENWE